MCDPLRWRALRWGDCRDRGFTLSISSPKTHVFADLPVCPTCSLQRCTKEGQGCCRNALSLALLTGKHSRTQRQTTELWGKYVRCLFYVVVAVFLSLISHAWHYLKVEFQHHGGKIWCFCYSWCYGSVDIFADEQDRTPTRCQRRCIHLGEAVRSVFLCVSNMLSQDMMTCSS